MSVTREAVLEYLKAHPEIFEEQAEFFNQVEIAHPYSGRTISLAERQMINLREKNRLLEHRLGELLGVGETNDALGARMHQLTIALVGANRLDQMVGMVLKSLAEDFGVPQARLRLWGEGAANLGYEVCTPVSAELVKEVSAMNHPVTGSVRTGEVAAWFGSEGDNEAIASMALVPLRFDGQTLGLLAMGSDDAERFVAGMGTLYIERLGDVIAAALARVLRA
jgi:uncharacterized protein YigA (DUF484 family)